MQEWEKAERMRWEDGEKQRDKQKVGAQIKLGGKWNAVHSAHSHVYKQTNMQQEANK